MVTKKPAMITQLKNANARIKELEAQVEKLSKEAASNKSTSDTWYRQHNEKESELEQLHSLLDALPNCLPRKSQNEESWRQKDMAAMTRLASWLAVR